MSLPPSFSGMPTEEQHHYYRNICIDFKKTIKSSKDCALLIEKMDGFLNASREVSWPHKTSNVFHKDEAEKAVQKVANEFRRYINELEKRPDEAKPNDLLTALELVESLVSLLKVR